MSINKTDVPVHQRELSSNSPTPALLDRKSAGLSKDAICLHSTLGHNIVDFPYTLLPTEHRALAFPAGS